MAKIHVDSTAGNDTTGTGTFANPYATLLKAYAVLAAGDEILLRGGKTYPLTQNLTTALNFSISGYFGDTTYPTIACGAFSFGGSSTNVVLNRIITTADNSVTSPNFTSASTTSLFFARDCVFKNMIRLGSGRLTLDIVTIDPADISGHTTCIVTGTPIINAFNCYFTKPLCSTSTANNNNFWFRGCVFNFYGKSFNKTHVLNQTTALSQGFGLFDFCSFVGMDSIFRYNSASSATSGDYAINRSYVDAGSVISNASTGILTIDGSPSTNNLFSSSTSKTNFTDYNSTTTADPKFYDLAGGNFHIEYDSPLADYNGDTVGAYVLEKPSTFFDTILESNVRLSTTYKAGSRTANKTGTLNLPATTDVKSGVSYDNATKTGSYDPITGLWESVSAVDLRSGVSKLQNGSTINGLLNLPAESNVKKNITYDNATKTGTLESTDPGESNVKSGTTYKIESVLKTGNRTDANPANVLTDSGTYGANGTELTPSYSPDFPSRSNVAPDDTVNGLSGTMDLPALNKVAPSDTLRGQAGTMDIPSLSNVLPEDTLEGQAGTANVDSLANLPAENEVLTGSGNFGKNLDKVPSYTPDFPSANSVLTTDTTNGVQGTVSLPNENLVSSGTTYGPNNSLVGSASLLDLTKFTDIPEDKVEEDYQWKYNSTTNNKTGTMPAEQSSTDPGEWNVLKDVDYVIDGVAKTGKYNTGELTQATGDNIRIKIFNEIQDSLYRINPATSAIYQNCIKSVSLESGLKYGLIQDDMPHVQIVADETSYDHQFILSGNKPKVNMRVKFIVSSPSNWTLLDNESLYEDIRQAFIRDNFTLNGLVISTKVISVKQVSAESDKKDDNRRAELVFEFVFIEEITDLN